MPPASAILITRMMRDMNGPKISDIPKFRELLEQAEAFHSMQKALPFLAPALKLLGVDTANLRDTLAQTDDLRAQIQEMAAIPDTFNDLFSHRGWIIYDYMNLDVARAAIKKAQSGDIDGAEADLAEHYDAEVVQWQLRIMWSVNAFRLRVPLAEKALEDYREERYHACVPVVLALLDGMVNEVHAKMGAARRGFAAEEVDLTAWNSIAGHNKGLNALVRIFQTGRYKTTVEAITIPYRNGILHGMDLGYDNRIVAAKTWAALFATRDWAVAAEKGALDAPPETPQPTWGDLVTQLQANEQIKNRLAEWKPRSITIGVDLPETGSPEEFAENTPERKLAEFLTYWKANIRPYGSLRDCNAQRANQQDGEPSEGTLQWSHLGPVSVRDDRGRSRCDHHHSRENMGARA